MIESGADYLFVDAGPTMSDDFFGVTSQESGVQSALRFRAYPFLREIRTKRIMILFELDTSVMADSGESLGRNGQLFWQYEHPCF